MYAPLFGLKHEPFSIAPDPRFLFMSKRHRGALACLLDNVKRGGGFVLLSGDSGAGKTTVCRCFLEQIPRRCNVAYIGNPKLTLAGLLGAVCDEFGIPYGLPGSAPLMPADFLEPLQAYLQRTDSVGQKNMLIIDEAQLLSAEVLDQLCRLIDIEVNQRKLLQVMLIGQPELRTKFDQAQFKPLARRIIARFHLKALSADESRRYIKHRLAVAGLTGPMPFERAALRRVHALSHGVPRSINLLCDRALLEACSRRNPRVDREIVDSAGVEVFGRSEPVVSTHSKPLRLAALACGVSLVAVGAVHIALMLIEERSYDEAETHPQLASKSIMPVARGGSAPAFASAFAAVSAVGGASVPAMPLAAPGQGAAASVGSDAPAVDSLRPVRAVPLASDDLHGSALPVRPAPAAEPAASAETLRVFSVAAGAPISPARASKRSASRARTLSEARGEPPQRDVAVTYSTEAAPAKGRSWTTAPLHGKSPADPGRSATTFASDPH